MPDPVSLFAEVPLGEFAEVEMGQSPSSSLVTKDSRRGLPFLQGNAEFGDRYPHARQWCTHPPKRSQAGDVLVSVRAPVGAINLSDQEYCIGRGLAAVRAPELPPILMAKLLEIQSPALRRVAQGTTFEAVNKNDLIGLKLRRPPAADSPMIAKVLDRLDRLISATRSGVGKLQSIRTGLLHDLLTSGIAEDGTLRPPFVTAPDLYHQSILGRVPRVWKAAPLSSLIADAYRYPSYFGISYVEHGIPEVRGEVIGSGGALAGEREAYRFITEATASRFPRVRLAPGDLVMTVRGTIGKFAAIPEWLAGGVITANLLKLRPASGVDADWLLHTLLSEGFQTRLDAACSATTIKTIQVPELLAIPIAVPPLEEQERIAKRLRKVSVQLQAEEDKLEKLKLLRVGLSGDLLTGRVRITPLLTGTAAPELEGIG